jgi:tetratricopeptide (TPR) repeat protein
LGECYLKIEEYDEAQRILEKAVNLYETEDYSSFNSHVYTYYYLGLLLLLGHLYMVCRSFSKAVVVYNKLIRGVQEFNEKYSTQKLMRTIPHILLIKYNLAESYRNLEKYEYADEIFMDILYKYSMSNEEHLE